MKILVTGISGQVGFELLRSLQPLGEVIGADRAQADLARPGQLYDWVRDLRPDVIVNPAAYTAVDKAESEEALATVINGDAPGALARAGREVGALLIHYSTDYVFDGSKDGVYLETDTPAPVSAYGRSKRAGEQAIAAAGGDWLVLRTAWVYGARGKNFLRTMLRLARERDSLRVVADQFGVPTPARLIADATAHILRAAQQERAAGAFRSATHHLVASGETSWHGFAAAIVDAARHRWDDIRAQHVEAITTADYPTPARRPANSRLSCAGLSARYGLTMPPWQLGLELVLDELRANDAG